MANRAKGAEAEESLNLGLGMTRRFGDLKLQSKDGETYGYRLYVPSKSTGVDDIPSSRPLLLWLHGWGEGGDDNVKHLRFLDLIFSMTGNSPPMFILAPQHPADRPWDQSMEVVEEILDHVVEEHRIDANRIYLAGISEGGTACWELSSRLPDRFAAIAPMASSGGNAARADSLKNNLIWAFHSSNDTVTPPTGVRAMVQAVRVAGGTVHLTETEPSDDESTSHDCWHRALGEGDLVHWLLAQRRGEPPSQWPPDDSALVSWRQAVEFRTLSELVRAYWPALGWACVTTVFVLAFRHEQRRRQDFKSPKHPTAES